MTAGQVQFYFDQVRCVGCGACVVACQDHHDLPFPPAGPGGKVPPEERAAQWRRVYTSELGRFPRVDVHHLCMSCFHCEEPACAKACPSGAVAKDPQTGFVLVDRERCQGCRQCQVACPYGAPQFAPAHTGDLAMQKCTFCAPRQAEGLPPVCVAACPYEALDAGPLEVLKVRHPEARPLDGGPGFEWFTDEHRATRPRLLVRSRTPRAEGPATLRRNGEVVSELRSVPGPDAERWRAQAERPYVVKPHRPGCGG